MYHVLQRRRRRTDPFEWTNRERVGTKATTKGRKKKEIKGRKNDVNSRVVGERDT